MLWRDYGEGRVQRRDQYGHRDERDDRSTETAATAPHGEQRCNGCEREGEETDRNDVRTRIDGDADTGDPPAIHELRCEDDDEHRRGAANRKCRKRSNRRAYACDRRHRYGGLNVAIQASGRAFIAHIATVLSGVHYCCPVAIPIRGLA